MREMWKHADGDGDSIRLTVESGRNPDGEFAFTSKHHGPFPVVVCANREALRALRDAINAELNATHTQHPETCQVYVGGRCNCGYFITVGEV